MDKRLRWVVYPWLVFGHLLGVVLLVAGFSIYVANTDRLQGAQTLNDLRALLSVVTVGERILIAGGAILIPFAVIMAIQFWSLSDGWIATSIVLVLVQGATGAIVNFKIRTMNTMISVVAASDVPSPQRSPESPGVASYGPSTVPPSPTSLRSFT